MPAEQIFKYIQYRTSLKNCFLFFSQILYIIMNEKRGFVMYDTRQYILYHT